MLDIFRGLVKQECPSFIIDFSTVTAGELSAVVCKYERNKKYYTASSFYTSTWISRVPSGPITHDGISKCEKLCDVANIVPHASITLCKSYPTIDESELKHWQTKQKKMFTRSFDDIFTANSFGDIMTADLILTPLPAMTVKIKNGSSIIGTMLVLPSGVTHVIFAVDQRVYKYAKEIERIRSSGHLYLPDSTHPAGINTINLE